MTRVFLVRHAEVENPDHIFYGHLESFGLSARGRAQAAAMGRMLRGEGIRRIVHSPLRRTRETATILAEALREGGEEVSLTADEGLIEAHFGRYLQGVPYVQVPYRRPLWFVHRLRRGWLRGDETIAAMGGRVIAVAKRLAREFPGEAAVCVSHADPLQAAWVLLEGRRESEREMGRKKVHHAGVIVVDFEGERVAGVGYRRAAE